MKKGLFITFEGIDGCGKSTQLELTKEYLEQKGHNVVITKEPGHGELGAQIRNIVLHNKGVVADKCEMFLFLADRAQHMETFIKPALEQGKIVLCDRHTDSTLAYQGYGRGQDIKLSEELNKLATGDTIPDLTLLYDVPVEVASGRVGKDKDRMESAGNNFQEKVRQGFIELSKKYPKRIKIIDTTPGIDEVFEKTIDYVNNKLSEQEK